MFFLSRPNSLYCLFKVLMLMVAYGDCWLKSISLLLRTIVKYNLIRLFTNPNPYPNSFSRNIIPLPDCTVFFIQWP